MAKRVKRRLDINGKPIKLSDEERCSQSVRGVKKWVAPADMPDAQVKRVLAGKECGATLANGNGYCTCKRVIVNENRPPPFRCKSHGGNNGNKKGTKPGITHGLYTDGMFEDEKALWDRLDVADLDDEIKMTKLRLRRAMKADKMRTFNFMEAQEHGYIEPWVTSKGYSEEIHDLIHQLVKLSAQRTSLQETALALKNGGTAQVIIYLPSNSRVKKDK